MITYDNIRKITIAQRDYSYFKEHYKMIGIYSSKQQVLNADPKGN